MKKFYLLLAIMSLFLIGCGTSDKDSDHVNNPSSENVIKSTFDVAEDSTKEASSKSEIIDEYTTTLIETSVSDEKNTQNTTTGINEEQTTTRQEDTIQMQTTSYVQVQTEVPTTTQPPTQSQTTTQPPTQVPTTTQPVTEATTNKIVVDYTRESSTTEENYKYGLKKLITVYDYYEVYSDGSKVKYSTNTVNKYDCSAYSATDEELLDESNAKAAANMSYYNEVLALVNQIRAEVGAAPLTLDTTLCQAATMRAVEMNYSDIFSHTRPDGRSCFSVFDTYNANWGSCGENIAAGYSSPAEVVNGWKNSEGHYANMINSNFTKLGVGMSNEEPGTYGHYWVQLFSNIKKYRTKNICSVLFIFILI